MYLVIRISHRYIDRSSTKLWSEFLAMMAGFDHARGDIIIAMDGDGQNDPAEISKLLVEIENGYDVVSGWRFSSRQDVNAQNTQQNCKLAHWCAEGVGCLTA